MANLSYVKNSTVGAQEDTIRVSLAFEEETACYITGTVYKVYDEGKNRVLALTDGYQKLCDTMVTPAYRRERARRILQDTLDAAGIKDTAISCPDVEVGRFSTMNINGARCITLLIKSLEEHGYKRLRYFFDAENVFHFGTGEDTGRNEGETVAFKSGKNIITKGDGYIEVLPLPIRHSQKITVDGIAMETIRTDLVVSRYRSRLTLWVKEA
jgi:hypothetical protein